MALTGIDGLGAQKISAGHPSRSGAARRGGRHRPLLQAADRDLEAGNAFLACDRRLGAAADRADEGLQLGTQRLGMADREVPRRLAAIGLEAEAFGDLTSEQ